MNLPKSPWKAPRQRRKNEALDSRERYVGSNPKRVKLSFRSTTVERFRLSSFDEVVWCLGIRVFSPANVSVKLDIVVIWLGQNVTTLQRKVLIDVL
ncbi:hypothetical protein Bca52824_001684 [Brassica carinata]|uniref:Uncharacterized protein n=1 Tax=Brassica carinata TaxID=52824 RepID=A0A8X8B9Y6_BRACI|nr:hypothetical protein Bca52824_001684 [Brassica carinata]